LAKVSQCPSLLQVQSSPAPVFADADDRRGSANVSSTIYREVQLPSAASEEIAGKAARLGSSFLAESAGVTDLQPSMMLEFKVWLSLFGLPIALCFLLSASFETGKTRADPLVGYRGFLVLTVFLYHTGLIPYSDVGAFFMLSGSVLTLSRQNAHWDGVLDVGIWIARRLLRILPPWWFAQAVWKTLAKVNYVDSWSKVIWCGLEMGAGMVSFPVTDPLRAFLLVDSTTELMTFWFIQPLVCFYILFPAFERILVPHKGTSSSRPVYVAAFCCFVKVCILWTVTQKQFEAASWYRIKVPWTETKVSMYTSALSRWPEFVLGMCLPHLSMHGKVAEVADTSRLVDFAALTLLLMPFLTKSSPIVLTSLLNNNVQFPLHCIILVGLCSGKPAKCTGAVTLLSSPALLFLGSISYSFYLQQWAVLLMMGAWQGGDSHPWQAVYCFRVLCALLLLLPTAWAATKFSEVLPSKVLEVITTRLKGVERSRDPMGPREQAVLK